MNDPLYGFINIDSALIFNLIEHKYFQRLRRISQLGLSSQVYPGANHTRFLHSIGAMHLMQQAIDSLRIKNIKISKKEEEASKIAILLHDIGHTPFSHSLENVLIEDLPHEEVTKLLFKQLNEEFDNKLELALKIFENKYHLKFLHQLVSSQLDVDRLDYLMRDSYFTGVTEGIIGIDRIIKMLNIKNGKLVVEEKGLYSIEKYLIARRLMYWQVYLHKTTFGLELILKAIIKRIRFLLKNNVKLNIEKEFLFFMSENVNNNYLKENTEELITNYTALDDYDIMHIVKQLIKNEDKVLRFLSTSFIERKLFKVKYSNKIYKEEEINKIKNDVEKQLKLPAEYFVQTGVVKKKAYSITEPQINILYKNNETKDITEASDIFKQNIITRIEKKHYLCFPKKTE